MDRTDAPDDRALRFPKLVQAAALMMFGAALAIAASVAQLKLVFTFGDTPWQWMPYALGVSVVALFIAGRSLFDGRRGSPLIATVVSTLSWALSGAWFVYAFLHAAFVPLPALAAAMCMSAAFLSALCFGPVRRYHAALQALHADVDVGAAFGSTLDHPDGGGGRPMLAALGITAAVASCGVWLVNDPLAAQRIDLRARMLAKARWPVAADAFVEARADYPYEGSPLVRYATYEAKWTPVDVDAIGAFADGIAEEVGWRMMVWTGERDVVSAERALWTSGQADRIPMWIAHGLRERDVFYHQESLLSRSFDPSLHDGDEVHLDCDLLVHLFEHVAWRLDLDFREVPAPMHVYLSYAAPAGFDAPALTVETTSFRQIDIDGNRIDFMGEGVGEDFLVAADWYSTGKNGTWASDDLVQAAQLYAPQDDRAVQDGIVANVLAGLDQRQIDAPLRQEAWARLDGTHSYVLVSNLWDQTVSLGQEALDRDDLPAAIETAREAVALRDRFPDLVLTTEPLDRQLLVESLVASGAPDLIAQAGPVLDVAIAVYESPVLDDDGRIVATDSHHAALLLLDATTRGVASAARCDQTLGTVARWIRAGRRRSPTPSLDDLCVVASEHPAACASLQGLCGG